METKFKIGDVVQLKSGGPKMTVTKLVMTVPLRGGQGQYTGKVKVSWFEGSDDKYGEFPQDSLDTV